MYFCGRGDLTIFSRDALGRWLAAQTFHCPMFEIEVETERLQHKNTSTAVAGLDLDIPVEFLPKVNFTVDTYDESILAMALGGAASEIETGASFSNQLFPNPVAVGKTYPVPGGYSNLDSLTITDSAGTPATLTAGTHYVGDLAKGLVRFVNLGAYTQPFKAAGAEADAFKVVSIATVGKVERGLRFCGVNLADDDQKIHNIDIYRASIPTGKAAGKTGENEVQSWEFNPSMLLDPNAPFDADFGQFGRWLKG